MHPLLVAWLTAHACYAFIGHVVPDAMPYVVAPATAVGTIATSDVAAAWR